MLRDDPGTTRDDPELVREDPGRVPDDPGLVRDDPKLVRDDPGDVDCRVLNRGHSSLIKGSQSAIAHSPEGDRTSPSVIADFSIHHDRPGWPSRLKARRGRWTALPADARVAPRPGFLPHSAARADQSMTRLPIVELLSGRVSRGTSVICGGWVRTRRDSKAGLSFIHVSDGSCFDPVQVVAKADLPNYDEVVRLTAGCSVIVEGTLIESEGKGQRFEIVAERVEVVGWVDDPETYPLSAKHHSFEHLRKVAHLRPRSNTFGAIARLRNSLSFAIHRYFHEHGFLWIHAPIITSSDSEGAGQAFAVTSLDLEKLPHTPDG